MNIQPTAASFLITEDCNLGCTYCVSGDTKITMSDFSQVAIREIKVGDSIMGFDENTEKGKHRQLQLTEVSQLFSRKAEVIEIELEDDIRIKITGNHKILNTRGNSEYAWKEAGKYKVGDKVKILPTIEFIDVDICDEDYRIGYFIAMMMGDGSVKYYKDGNGYDAYRVRLAVKDDEIIFRMKEYFNYFDIDYTIRKFKISTKYDIYKDAIFSSKRESYLKIKDIIENNFTSNTSPNYYNGFLAGIYDAEGNLGKDGRIIRICNSDRKILDEIKIGLKMLNINFVEEKRKYIVNNQTYDIRILNETTLSSLKFVLNVNPAVARKGLSGFYGTSPFISKKIISIKTIGDEDVYNIGTGTRTYIANNIMVHNCFEEHNKKIITEEVIERGLDLLCRNAVNQGTDFNALIFGGEPLMQPKLVKHLFDFALKLAKLNNKKFSAQIVTNATILTDEVYALIYDYMYSCNLSVQLSVDGDRETQDRYRVTKAGKGSFKLVERNIPKWKKLFENNMSMLSVHGCVNKLSMPALYDNYIFFRETWGIPRIWFMPIHTEEWDENDVGLYQRELGLIADYVLKKSKENNNLEEVYNYSPIDRCMNGDQRPDHPCGAGRNFVTVTADGDIYPCHHFYFNDPKCETKFGDVFSGIDDSKRQLYLSYEDKDISCESDCECVHCYRCIAENYEVNGSIFSQIKGYRCDLSKIEREIQVYIREEVIKMGLANEQNNQPGNNPNNPACLCDLGSPSQGKPSKSCGDSCNCKKEEKEDSTEIISSALQHIIQRIDEIEKEQKYMKNLLEIITKKVL